MMTHAKNHHAVRSWEGLVNQLFSDVERNFQATVKTGTPAANIVETADAFHVALLAPGRDKSLFELKVENDVLTIAYKANAEANQPELKYTRKEFGLGDFSRSFSLNEKVDADQIQAKYEDGILKLLLPKKAELKPAARQITIS